MNNHINIFKECFSKISTEELFGRIALYRERLKADVMSEAEIQASLANIFEVELNEANVTFFIKNDWQSDPYHLINFYRIRKFTTEDYSGLRDRKFPSMRKESDI